MSQKNPLQALIGPAIEKIEHRYGWIVLTDGKILEECFERTKRSLDHLGEGGIPKPNAIKTAGHLAFWLRKLKPFSLFNLDAQRRILEAAGLDVPALREGVPPQLADRQIRPQGFSAIAVNEMVAIVCACGYVEKFHVPATELAVTASFFNDLLVGLRYHSYSPSSLAIIFEALISGASK